MIINIDEKYFLKQDGQGYHLYERLGGFDKENKEKVKIHGYYGKIEMALNRLTLLMSYEEGKEVGISQYIQDLKQIRQKLAELVQWKE